MKNVTITVPESVARWARVWAARNNSSVSRLVGELLTSRMMQDKAYGAAMRRFLGKPPCRLRKRGERYPRRDELYGR